MLWRNPVASIADFDSDRAMTDNGRQAHVTACRRVAKRIRNQIAKCSLEQRAIEGCRHRLAVNDVHADTCLRSGRLIKLTNGPELMAHVDERPVDLRFRVLARARNISPSIICDRRLDSSSTEANVS